MTVSCYCVWLMLVRNSEGADPIEYPIPEPVPAFIPAGFWATVGFAIYSYEGIGIVMPILAKSERPDKFITCLMCAIATLSILFVVFGEITVFAFG